MKRTTTTLLALAAMLLLGGCDYAMCFVPWSDLCGIVP
jgi:hypothetical protein